MKGHQKRPKPPARPPGDVLTVDEVAKRLRVARLTAYRAIRNGGLPSIRVGRRYLIPRIAFERMLASGRPIAAEANAV
jgi:excisionase family DNA binding protein